MMLPKLINQISMDDGIIFNLAFITFINTQHQHGQHQFHIKHHDTVVSQCRGKGCDHEIVATGAWFVEIAGGGVQRSTNVSN
jgi:hypothetical protein